MMGWTTCYSAQFWKTVGGRRVVDRQKECDKLLTWCRKDENGNVVSSGEVLKSAMVGSTYYAAVRNAKGEVWAAVFLTCGKSRWDNTIWGYKDMEESMGPCECSCPASVLSLLSPTDDKDALKWREKCRQNIAQAAEKRKNKGKPLYAPAGISVTENRGAWIFTSEHYRSIRAYSGVKFTKVRWHDYDTALRRFVEAYGTAEQKAEMAKRGGRHEPESI